VAANLISSDLEARVMRAFVETAQNESPARFKEFFDPEEARA